MFPSFFGTKSTDEKVPSVTSLSLSDSKSGEAQPAPKEGRLKKVEDSSEEEEEEEAKAHVRPRRQSIGDFTDLVDKINDVEEDDSGKVVFCRSSMAGLNEDGRPKTNQDRCDRFKIPIGGKTLTLDILADGHGRGSGEHIAQFILESLPNLLVQEGQHVDLEDAKTKPQLMFDIIRSAVSIVVETLRHSKNFDISGGSTLVGSLLDPSDGSLWHFNLGDSGLFLIDQDEGGVWQAKKVTVDHTNENPEEVHRIAGHEDGYFHGPYMAGGTGPQCTRGIGDFQFEKNGMISQPDFGFIKLKSGQFTLLASDGILDGLADLHGEPSVQASEQRLAKSFGDNDGDIKAVEGDLFQCTFQWWKTDSSHPDYDFEDQFGEFQTSNYRDDQALMISQFIAAARARTKVNTGRGKARRASIDPLDVGHTARMVSSSSSAAKTPMRSTTKGSIPFASSRSTSGSTKRVSTPFAYASLKSPSPTRQHTSPTSMHLSPKSYSIVKAADANLKEAEAKAVEAETKRLQADKERLEAQAKCNRSTLPADKQVMIDQAEAIKEFAKKAAESQQQQPAVSASTAASAPALASSTKATPRKDDKKQPPNGELDPLGTGKPSLHTKYNYHLDGELCSFHDHQAKWKVAGKDRRFKTCLAVELQRPEGMRDGMLRLLVKWIDRNTGDPLFFVTHKHEGGLKQYVHQ